MSVRLALLALSLLLALASAKEEKLARPERASPLRWGKREPLRWGKRDHSIGNEEQDMYQTPMRVLREAPLRWGKRSESSIGLGSNFQRMLRESPLRWGKRRPLRFGKRSLTVHLDEEDMARLLGVLEDEDEMLEQ